MTSLERICDLHTHSSYSDGSLSPRELLALAEKSGLSAIALCDHNTVAGLPAFLEAAKDFSVEAIPAAEFSVEYNDLELHLLAMFIPEDQFGNITEKMEDFCRRKEQSNIDLVAALERAGIHIDYAQLRKDNPDGYMNRAHIATAMTRQGYTGSVKEAFQEYLAPSKGFYVPPKLMNVYDAIRWIRSMGAVSVLAHPFLNLYPQRVEAFLPKAAGAGLDAVETMYAKYTPETTALSQKWAEENGLLQSGGSDFHGLSKPDISLGTGRGDLRIPYRFLQQLKDRKKEREISPK